MPVPEEGRPLDWTGAVGPVEVSRDAQRRDIDLGDSLELSVRYSGSGNLEFFEAPKLERIEGLYGLCRCRVCICVSFVAILGPVAPR